MAEVQITEKFGGQHPNGAPNSCLFCQPAHCLAHCLLHGEAKPAEDFLVVLLPACSGCRLLLSGKVWDHFVSESNISACCVGGEHGTRLGQGFSIGQMHAKCSCRG